MHDHDVPTLDHAHPEHPDAVFDHLRDVHRTEWDPTINAVALGAASHMHADLHPGEDIPRA